MKKVSIIIPTYNEINLLPKCIESCLGQTMPKKAFEILIIDDCSTDGTYDVIQSYAKDFPDLIKVIKTDKNSGGASIPRNLGIEFSIGEYLFFIDADDTIASKTLENGYLLAKENNSDVVLISRLDCYQSGKEAPNATDLLLRENYESCLIIPNVSLDKLSRPLLFCSHFFKRVPIEKLSIKYNKNVLVADDAYFLNEVLINVKNVRVSALLDEPYYFWNVDTPESIHLTGTYERQMYSIKNVKEWFVMLNSSQNIKISNSVYAQGIFKRWIVSPLLCEARAHPEAFGFLSSMINEYIPIKQQNFCTPEDSILLNAIRLNDVIGFERYEKYNEKYLAYKKKTKLFKKENARLRKEINKATKK